MEGQPLRAGETMTSLRDQSSILSFNKYLRAPTLSQALFLAIGVGAEQANKTLVPMSFLNKRQAPREAGRGLKRYLQSG